MQNISSQILSYLNHGNDRENTAATILRKELKETITFLNNSLHSDPSILNTAARDISLVLAHIYIGKTIMYLMVAGLNKQYTNHLTSFYVVLMCYGVLMWSVECLIRLSLINSQESV